MDKYDIKTPFGVVHVSAEDDAIVGLGWGSTGRMDKTPVLVEAAQQINAYCVGTLTAFDLPMELSGRDLQRAVCAKMRAIPFGETRTYGEIAKDLALSAQTIGQACGRNPIPILIPCHRVMGAKGLTGFSGAGGVETKLALLKHEGAGGFLI
ncbi:MAG: methylated-DNA--[protein]-cysteine S-methyltransferase [Pseudomonadota bacterium]